jgi:hypothetical protein
MPGIKKRKLVTKEKKKALSYEDIENEITRIAMGDYKNFIEGDLRLKALVQLHQLKSKRESIGINTGVIAEPIQVEIVNPTSVDQNDRVTQIEQMIKKQGENE